MVGGYFVGISHGEFYISNSVYFPKKLLVSKNIPKFALVHS